MNYEKYTKNIQKRGKKKSTYTHTHKKYNI